VHGWLAGRSNDLIVVEFAQMVSGPMCAKKLADMGAEVIKIEPPGAGGFSPAGTAFPLSVSLASEFPHGET